MQREQSVTLGSPTFIGLLLAQFTATFNDQATHMVAVFFASDMLIRYVQSRVFDEKATPAIVALCFMLPFFFFSPLAGKLADRFSKRSMIVLWKAAEVGFMLLALGALSVPALSGPGGPPAWLAVTAGLVMVGTVFLMGLHSTFFVPAKYGIMPEILDHSILSRGNGFLEGTSFMAQIFGTSAGGIVYALCKSEIYGPGRLEPGREWIVGLVLVALATVGMGTSILMKPVPPAAPDRPVTWTWVGPLRENLSTLVGARPLLLALIGVTFVAFMTVFLRQTLLYDAELRGKPEAAERVVMHRDDEPAVKPHRSPTMRERLHEAMREPELKVSLLIALVGFGVGLGSLTAGYFSGDRVELGLVPIGSVAMIAMAVPMALCLDSTPALVVILFFLGMSAGFVVVPLYTQMQHRAPRERKGNIIAAANFIYVCGGITSIVLFFLLAWALERQFSSGMTLASVKENPALLEPFKQDIARQMTVPKILIMLTGLFTIAMSVVLWAFQPDFPLRTAIWLRRIGKRRVHVSGVDDLPLTGPVVVQANCHSFLETLYLMACIDRSTQIIVFEPAAAQENGFLKWLARRCGWCVLKEGASESEWLRAAEIGLYALLHDHIAGMAVIPGDAATAERAHRVVNAWREATGASIVAAGTQVRGTG